MITKEEKTEKEEIFEKTQKRVIKWFLEKDIPMHLVGFKYIVYILSKRLTGEWNGGNLVKEYEETAKVLGHQGHQGHLLKCVYEILEKVMVSNVQIPHT